ncbi:sulfotransferase sult [Holotrichia oblita]|uniref:Sulfotransferase sult n=1 Tax=Holotrichia oblita TaxID=644536 RepID=A0ACB9T1Z1_HOLOL|nr:sulfotransferase sult [Holotrichia oblita]
MSFTYTPLERCYSEKLDKWFGKKDCFYEFNPGKFVMPLEYSLMARDILDLEVRPDDVWLISFSRTGSTWCQEIMWLIANNLDFEKATSTIQQLRAPLLEGSIYFGDNPEYCRLVGGNSIEYVKGLPSPRFIKSHIPYEQLPTKLHIIKPKIIYMARNPKDICRSYHPHMQMFYGMNVSFEESAKMFCEGKMPLGDVLDHSLEFWKRRGESHILFLKYEDLRSNTKGTIRLIAEFLGKPLTDEEIDKIYDFLTLKKMRDNPSVNMETFTAFHQKNGRRNGGVPFIGDGKIGAWKERMTLEISKMFDDWIEDKTKGTGLQF